MFSRTQNENGTFNSRCLYCFMTIAFELETSEELEAVELHHVCPERVLAEMAAHETYPWRELRRRA